MITPSIASAHPLRYGSEIDRLNNACRSLHIDLEDGNFIPNITFGLKTVSAIRKAYPEMPLNAHLMVTDPLPYLVPLAELRIGEIALHLESLPYPLAALNKARRLGMSPGLALNFLTPVSHILPFLAAIDFLLIMTAEPDDQGDKFHPHSLSRVAEARNMLPSGKTIWVDGGIRERELPLLREAGADVVVMGREIFGSSDPAARLAALHALFSSSPGPAQK